MLTVTGEYKNVNEKRNRISTELEQEQNYNITRTGLEENQKRIRTELEQN